MIAWGFNCGAMSVLDLHVYLEEGKEILIGDSSKAGRTREPKNK
jgi:hypothetical protein